MVQEDDGVRMKCEQCGERFIPDGNDDVYTCDECEQGMRLCPACAPDPDLEKEGLVWLCPECRKPESAEEARP